ncbi:MAG: nitrilase-related carbon-nitrogen hydrolase [Dermatophilaceae bacterium]
MRIAVIQIGYDDREPVADRVTRAADLVRAQAGHDLVVLPELWAPGGFSYQSWAERAERVDGPVAAAMSAAARDAGVMLHAGSIIEHPANGAPGPEGKDLWNTSLVFASDGSLAATYRKIHRFGFGRGEPLLLEAGSELSLVDVPDSSPGAEPARAALSTCYDLRFPELYRAQLDAGATLFVIAAAWPAARVRHWTLLAHARAIENQCVVVACNTAGAHAGVEMGGHSQVVLPTGEVSAVAGGGQQVLSVDVDMSVVSAYRASFPVLSDRRLPLTPG